MTVCERFTVVWPPEAADPGAVTGSPDVDEVRQRAPVSVDPSVAARVSQPDDPWAGVWIAEDIELIAQGVRNGSWVDGSLGVVGAGLDGLAVVSDPVGTLLQYGVSWIIEHVRPLSQALDWLAGDPGLIAGNAQTWRNVSSSLAGQADAVGRYVAADVPDWRGAAAAAYRQWSGRQEAAIRGLATAADAMAAVTEGAGLLIAAVRMLVRDAIATCVSRLVVYAAEEVFSLGLATPLVVAQVSTLVASWAAKIARWLRALLASLRELVPVVRRLGVLIEELKTILTRLRGKEPEFPKEPPKVKDPRLEEQRVHDLGMDPATGTFRPREAQTAVRVEQALGIELKRSPTRPSTGWTRPARPTMP
jgi:hypothetical protein